PDRDVRSHREGQGVVDPWNAGELGEAADGGGLQRGGHRVRARVRCELAEQPVQRGGFGAVQVDAGVQVECGDAEARAAELHHGRLPGAPGDGLPARGASPRASRWRSKRPSPGKNTVTVRRVNPGCHGWVVTWRRNPPGSVSGPDGCVLPNLVRSIASSAYAIACDHSRELATSAWLPWNTCT